MADLDIDVCIDEAQDSAPRPVLRQPSLTIVNELTPDIMPFDCRGRPFDLPVDSEHKACRVALVSFRQPHMAAFHLAWMSFFASFMAAFAAAPMIPVIREDLNLSQTCIGVAGVTAVTGTIFSRVLMGSVCDTIGPRYGFAVLLLTTGNNFSKGASLLCSFLKFFLADPGPVACCCRLLAAGAHKQ